MMNSQAMLATIKDYVAKERSRLHITSVDTAMKSEPSGEAFNEFALLLDRQLLTTAEGHGGWLSLNDAEILESVYRIVLRRIGPDAS